ncbi:MAG TPA: DUF2309 domain-containing protein [Vicinamibacteria bacterium]|nr:DUF2309 domain-containing protein [Vicinamibacteria bacterium]
MHRAALLEEAVRRATHLLPAQGPISTFIHHNTLHAFEHLPFEEAVIEAGRLFGCEPFLEKERYRREMTKGRIRLEDVDAVLERELGDEAEEMVGGLATRRQIRLAMLRHRFPEESGPALAWLLAETPAVSRNRPLWQAALDAVSRSALSPLPLPNDEPLRHRDLLLEVTGADSDDVVHPVLIRLTASFLDQGLAYWPLPGREGGFFRAVGELYRPSRFLPGWLRRFAFDLSAASQRGLIPAESAIDSLDRLGVSDESEWEPFVAATLLALRGFAGMMWQIESRPDRVPVHAPKASLVDFLAIRLLLEVRALEELACKTLGFHGQMRELRDELRRKRPSALIPNVEERAYRLFLLAEALGCPPSSLSQLNAEATERILDEIEAFSALSRRRLLHLAYERRHRIELLDALSARAGEPSEGTKDVMFQAVFCIDEREESIRRHLEEVEPRCETFGAAGFFGVAMYYRGVADAHARPLCPIAIEPEHEVIEMADSELGLNPNRRRTIRRFLGRLLHETHVGSRTFTRGTLLTAVLGLATAIPLTFRVLFPRLTASLRSGAGSLLEPRRARLALDRDQTRKPSLGKYSGFSVPEMAGIVGRLLEDVGISDHLARIVVVVGHGSRSLNNPHESAHDCGACGGGRGGPNARAFAQMANDRRVRELIRKQGSAIPDSTWFVGAYHDSCDDSVTLADRDLVPPEFRGKLVLVENALERARARNAHERCRRFEFLPPGLTPGAALAHVEGRSEDLAQPRPEYGHATNAICIIGRRSRSRGLFLDRRAFLVSYDPGRDDSEGSILARTLEAALPVVAGINLEYYFSYVDPVGYGCSTKLPHNITALLGVMDGHASDLRTGLPWQMVEIHEPVRLLVVVETTTELLERALARNPRLLRLADNRWIQLATLSASGNEIRLREATGYSKYDSGKKTLDRFLSSRDYYEGRTDHLPPALIASRPAGS